MDLEIKDALEKERVEIPGMVETKVACSAGVFMSTLTVRYGPDDGGWGGAGITPLPGNEEVVIFHGAWVLPEHRGLGNGNTYHAHRLRAVQRAGAKVALCTVNDANVAQVAILLKNGWRRLVDISQNAGLWCKSLGK